MASIAVEKLRNGNTATVRESAEEAVRAAGSSAVFLQPWLLQNLIGLDRGPGVSALSAPHREIHIIGRQRLLDLAADASLPLPDGLPGSDTLILLARAEADWAAAHTSAELLRHYWRLLFHARIDQCLRAKLSMSGCGQGVIEERIERIGRGVFSEAKFVLERERYLPPRSDDREALGEFVAVFLELATFRPDLLPVYFPSADVGKVLAAIAEDVDADDLLRQTRPSGAADPSPPLDVEHSTVADEFNAPADSDIGAELARDSRKRSALLVRAGKAASAGNAVRAALLRMRVSCAWPADETARTSALAALDTLTSRLRETIVFSDDSVIQWRSALAALLETLGPRLVERGRPPALRPSESLRLPRARDLFRRRGRVAAGAVPPASPPTAAPAAAGAASQSPPIGFTSSRAHAPLHCRADPARATAS